MIRHMKGHKNSKGEKAEWVIVSHETGKILSSHKSKEKAKEHMRQMKIFKENTNMPATKKSWNHYNEWLEKKIEYIDEWIADFIDENPEVDDEEIGKEIAEAIYAVLSDSFNDFTDSELYEIVKRSLITEYISYMFAEWYTGEKDKEDYYLQILDELD